MKQCKKRSSSRAFFLWLGVSLLAVMLYSEAWAQPCYDQSIECKNTPWQQRVRYVNVGQYQQICILKVMYRVKFCDGFCNIYIDSAVVPPWWETCRNMCFPTPTPPLNILLDRIYADILSYGVFGTPCSQSGAGFYRIWKPMCWTQGWVGGGGIGSAEYRFKPCTNTYCCGIPYQITVSGGVKTITQSGPAVLYGTPVDCNLLGCETVLCP